MCFHELQGTKDTEWAEQVMLLEREDELDGG